MILWCWNADAIDHVWLVFRQWVIGRIPFRAHLFLFCLNWCNKLPLILRNMRCLIGSVYMLFGNNCATHIFGFLCGCESASWWDCSLDLSILIILLILWSFVFTWCHHVSDYFVILCWSSDLPIILVDKLVLIDVSLHWIEHLRWLHINLLVCILPLDRRMGRCYHSLLKRSIILSWRSLPITWLIFWLSSVSHSLSRLRSIVCKAVLLLWSFWDCPCLCLELHH